MAVFEDHLPDIVHPLVQMEAYQPLGVADAAHGGGLENQPGGPVGVEGSGNYAGFRGHIPQLLGDLRLAQHQAADVHFQSPADHVRLMAAKHNALLFLEQQILPALGQGNGHFTGNGVRVFSGLVEDPSFQNGQDIEQRHLIQHTGGDIGHVIIGNVRPGQNAVEGAVLVGHRNGGNGGVVLQLIPGSAHGDAGVQDGRPVKIQVPDLVIQVGDPLGGLKTKAVQHDPGLVGDPAQAGGFIFPLAAGVAQSGIGNGGHNGIRVGIPVSGDINWIHE